LPQARLSDHNFFRHSFWRLNNSQANYLQRKNHQRRCWSSTPCVCN